VTGTDTGVGKTVVAAALMHRCRSRHPLRYWKPIQTGIEQDDDTGEVERLGACAAAELLTAGIRLPHPVSPHLAAKWRGTTIDLQQLVAAAAPDDDTTRWIVEGAGGVLVPVNERETMIDLMSALGLPVVVAARTRLGTINHTLLTLQALRQRGLPIAGVVMVGERNRDNRDAIEHYGEVAVLAEMPVFAPLTPAALGEWAAVGLDHEDRLRTFL